MDIDFVNTHQLFILEPLWPILYLPGWWNNLPVQINAGWPLQHCASPFSSHLLLKFLVTSVMLTALKSVKLRKRPDTEFSKTCSLLKTAFLFFFMRIISKGLFCSEIMVISTSCHLIAFFDMLIMAISWLLRLLVTFYISLSVCE